MKILGLLLINAFFLFQTSCVFDWIKNEVTVYPVLEDNKLGLIPLRTTVYKVFPESQTVIYWHSGGGEIPEKLSNCTVRDRLHWQCEYRDRSAKLIMNDGDFKEISAQKDYVDKFKYVSWWKWWMLSILRVIK